MPTGQALHARCPPHPVSPLHYVLQVGVHHWGASKAHLRCSHAPGAHTRHHARVHARPARHPPAGPPIAADDCRRRPPIGREFSHVGCQGDGGAKGGIKKGGP